MLMQIVDFLLMRRKSKRQEAVEEYPGPWSQTVGQDLKTKTIHLTITSDSYVTISGIIVNNKAYEFSPNPPRLASGDKLDLTINERTE